jgi:hypothetical protein
MNKQPVTTIMTHLVRAAFFFVPLFLAIIAISFAQGQRQNNRRSISNSELSCNGDLRGAGARRSQKDLEYDRTYRVDEHGNHARGIAFAAPKGRNDRRARIAGGGAWSLLGPPGGDVFDAAVSTIDSAIALAGIAPDGSFGGTLYRSSDGGNTWSEVSALDGTSVFDIEFTPDGMAYIGTQDSIRKSTDNGLSWVTLNLGIGLNDQVFDRSEERV